MDDREITEPRFQFTHEQHKEAISAEICFLASHTPTAIEMMKAFGARADEIKAENRKNDEQRTFIKNG